MSRRNLLIAVFFALWMTMAGCILVPPTSIPSQMMTPVATEMTSTPMIEKLTLGLGYIPSVQFAPFYVAREKGYFAEEGLEVVFQHGFETDFIKLVGTDELQFAVASGEQVILAQAQGLPVIYVMTWYNRFPVVVFALKEKGLNTPKALEGHRVGIPGLFGASFIAWKALVYAAGIDESKVTLESIGFTQAEAVAQGRVDAALDYAVNGPVKLRQAGREVDVIQVSDYINLPSNGLVTNEKTIRERPELVQRMVRALLRGLEDTLNHPDEAFAISIQAVPEAGGENEPVNRAIFNTVLDEWRPPTGKVLGWSDPERWAQAARFMREMGLVDVEVDVGKLFTNRFVEAS
ncbi:MAG: ABC transporter substrate-binding protein [Anaerolineae bacterium]|nr:ABC transporter substrate-binding protein [Anaerolineae bacterium]MDW8098527.1 ABC transporter substrate-binding protein [Anaerolineae bacterium]